MARGFAASGAETSLAAGGGAIAAGRCEQNVNQAIEMSVNQVEQLCMKALQFRDAG